MAVRGQRKGTKHVFITLLHQSWLGEGQAGCLTGNQQVFLERTHCRAMNQARLAVIKNKNRKFQTVQRKESSKGGQIEVIKYPNGCTSLSVQIKDG